MKSKILSALLMLLPFTNLTAYIDEDDGEVVDQFMLTMSTSGFVLCKAIDMAREANFRYVKILSAEYSVGNQSGGFVCQIDDEDLGEVFNYEDETFRLSISCLSFTPSDSDYIDTEDYDSLSDLLNEESEDDDSFDDDSFDDDSLDDDDSFDDDSSEEDIY